MKHLNALFIAFSFLFYLTIHSQEKENNFNFKWDNGFKLENADKSFKLAFGGRLMLDHAFFSQDEDLDAAFGPLVTKNGTEIRRARLFTSGTIYNNVVFKFDLSFEGGEVGMKDMYIGLQNVPVVGNIRVGNVKEPFRLEMLTSSKYITFLERSLTSDFSPTRNNGILLFNEFANKTVGMQAGLFRNANGIADDIMANDGYVFTGRITWLPLEDNENEKLLHLGLGYSYRKPEIKEYKVSSRPESHLSSFKYLNTGTINDVKNINLINVEAAFVKGPFSMQSEYLSSKVSSFNDYSFAAYYAQTSYFFTGEYKKYKGSYEGFDRVKPKENFAGNKGSGAWELALRYSHSDLNSEDITGGEQSDITLGVNWYLNPVTRIMFNHIWEDVKNTGKASIFEVRFQVDF